jgi:site-specific DNA-methyltransferase (adenine-specific)
VASKIPTPAYDWDGIRLYHGDCLEILPTLADGSVDCVLTDPPYGIAKGAAFVRSGTRIVSDQTDEGWNVGDWGWLPLAARILKPGGYLAAFHDMAQIEATLASFREAGIEPWRRFFVVKQTPPPTPRKTFVSSVEECVIGVKEGGPRTWHGGGSDRDTWIGRMPSQAGKGSGHPAEKPLEAISAMLQALCPEGGAVLDCFAGRATTLVAAMKSGRRAIGIEIDPGHVENAIRRLQGAETPLFGGMQ